MAILADARERGGQDPPRRSDRPTPARRRSRHKQRSKQQARAKAKAAKAARRNEPLTRRTGLRARNVHVAGAEGAALRGEAGALEADERERLAALALRRRVAAPDVGEVSKSSAATNG